MTTRLHTLMSRAVLVVSAIMAAILMAAHPAHAQTTSLTASAEDGGKPLHIGAHVGVVLPQLQSELGSALGLELEAGYRVWKNLSPFVGVSYTQPSVHHSALDPRLPVDYMTDTTQREIIVTAGVMWRFLPAGSTFNAYGGLGARIWLLETITNGEAGGAEFLENRETSTRVGFGASAGAEYALGPGAATAELDLGSSDLPHLITGDVATTALSATVGYRMMF